MSRSEILEGISAERRRQDELWGEQNHGPDHWITILAEEVGEAAKEALDCPGPGPAGRLRTEVMQVASVAVAAIECIDRFMAITEARFDDDPAAASISDGTRL